MLELHHHLDSLGTGEIRNATGRDTLRACQKLPARYRGFTQRPVHVRLTPPSVASLLTKGRGRLTATCAE